ncbi:MAG TPA: hypothetical protein VFG09_02325 [Thermodesulfovibrionales bacterium]|nr:hypothetical protein [Thermodesulfovibrionales bacterium]
MKKDVAGMLNMPGKTIYRRIQNKTMPLSGRLAGEVFLQKEAETFGRTLQ